MASLEDRIKGLERELAASKESEEALQSDVEEITALARAERESHLEAQGKLDAGMGPEGPAGEGTQLQSDEFKRMVMAL